MEGEYTPTIIRLILSTDLVIIQLKDSLKFFVFLTVIRSLILIQILPSSIPTI